MAKTYQVDATEFALQCGYQSDQEAADALGIPKEKAQDLTWTDSREVLYFRSNDSSLLKTITLPENVRLCLSIPEHLTWLPLTTMRFTPQGDYKPRAEVVARLQNLPLSFLNPRRHILPA